MLHGVVMAGGSGTRFWPLSRTARPKQLLTLAGDRSLLQGTRDRCLPLIPDERQWVVTNRLQAEEVSRQWPELPAGHILVEPCGRNTAPCIGLAALALLRTDPDAVMAVMPSDHVIRPTESFRAAIAHADALVRQDPARLVLFGVLPTYPATGFGYIERGELLAEDQALIPDAESPSGSPPTTHYSPLTSPPHPALTTLPRTTAARVASFREKPRAEVAEEYLRTARYYWNCGIFVWRARTILDALARFEPELHEGLQRIGADLGTQQEAATIEHVFPTLKSISIDYAVLERAANVCVLEAPFEWDDVGSWESVARLRGQDAQGNTIVGPHVGLDTRGCLVHGTPDHLIATIDVEDLLIVHTPDATLVARRGDEDSLRRLIAELKARGLEGRL